MKKLVLSSIALFSLLIIWQCGGSSTGNDDFERELTVSEKKLVESDNLFGFNIFHKIVENQTGGNVFLSPLSISMALGMTLNGAEGTTKSEMEATLQLAGLTREEINRSYQSLIKLLTNLDPKVKFEIANSIWTRLGFDVKEQFYNNNRDYFNAQVEEVDFNNVATVAKINDWVNEKTHGKIDKIIKGAIDPLTMMILINAIYFKGDWTEQFVKEATMPLPFYLADGSDTTCQMMNMVFDFDYMENDDFQAVELPYGDGDFSMVVFLPKEEDIATDVDEFIANFTAVSWSDYLERFNSAEIDLSLPKFELEWEMPLNGVLQALGMNAAFNPNTADFSGIADVGNLHISEVLHKTYVKVDEEGTEAAAVTSVTVGTTSGLPENTVMRINRPFAFIIKENKSGTILFMGKVENPTE